MDINQQLEYLNLSSDVLTEKDVLDTISYDSNKVVSSKGIYEALQSLSASVSDDYILRTDAIERIQNLSDQLSDYQKAGDYISGSMLDVIATKSFVTGQNYLKTHQSLSNYYQKNETSSAEQLSVKFKDVNSNVESRLLADTFNREISNYVLSADLDKIGYISSHQSLSNYYQKNETSSKYDLIQAFSRYYDITKSYSKGQIDSLLKKYCFLSDVFTKDQIEDILNLYALSCDVSSKAELNAAFEKCSKISVNVSSDAELSAEFAKYQKIGNYAVSSDVSSKDDISEELKNYVKKNDLSIKVSSDLELRIEFAKYQKKDDYALSSDVSSKIELSHEFDRYVKKNDFDLSDYAKKNIISTKYELSEEFAKYQKKGNYALSSDVSSKTELDEAFSKCSKLSINVSSDIELKDEFSKYQKKGNYALCTDVSSKTELDEAFAKCTKLSVNVSSDAELSAEFAKYALIEDTYKFALKNNVSTALQLCSEFLKYQEKGNYLISSDVSSNQQLNDEFRKYAAKIELSDYAKIDSISSNDQLNEEFEKYQKKGNYALSNDVSSAQQISEKLSEYSKLQLNGELNGELSDEFAKYMQLSDAFNKTQIKYIFNSLSNCVSSQYITKFDVSSYALSNDVKNALNDYALKSNVMSRDELSDKFKQISDEFDNTLHLDRDSELSGSLNVKHRLNSNVMSANSFNIDFDRQYNSNPIELISSVTNTVENDMSFGKLFNSMNVLILDSELSVKLLDMKQSSGDTLEILLSTLNSINDITKSKKQDVNSQFENYITSINDNVSLLSSVVSSYNLQQSLSSLGNKLHVVNTKVNYNSDLIADVITELDKSYPKSQTSSAYDIRDALNRKQDKGNYAYLSTLNNYVKAQYVNDNFVSKLSSANNIIDSYNTFKKSVIIENELIANSMKIDFANLVDSKKETCLSGYLLFLQTEFILDIAIRINEIIEYCKLDIDVIHRPENIYDQIITKTNKILVYANLKELPYGSTYFDIQNALNVAITKIHIKNGLSLQQVLQSNQYTNILQSMYMMHLSSDIFELSNKSVDTEMIKSYALSSDVNSKIDNFSYTLANTVSSAISSITVDSQLSDVIDSIIKLRNSLSDFA